MLCNICNAMHLCASVCVFCVVLSVCGVCVVCVCVCVSLCLWSSLPVLVGGCVWSTLCKCFAIPGDIAVQNSLNRTAVPF